VVAGAVALALTSILRALGLGVFLPEVAVDFVVARVPGGVESLFIRTMGEGAKVLAVLTALVVFLLLPGIPATLFRAAQRRLPRRWEAIAAYTLGYAGLNLLVALPLLGGGFGGSETAAGPWFATFSQLLGGWLYAAVLDYLLVDLAAKHPGAFLGSRRRFIVAGTLTLAGIALALYSLGRFVATPARLAFASVGDMLNKEVTPTDEFYIVTKNVVDPSVDVGSWRLTVDGLVANPTTYAYADLLARAQAEEFVTFECVSNEVGGNLMSSAKWRGLAMADLITAAGVQPVADWVALSSVDGYTVGIPLTRAMAPGTLLALKMNDEVLGMRHGFPARVVVPGLYGMFSAKWVTRITLVQGEFVGFWQQKGWTNRGAIRTTAIIATPAPNAVVRGPTTIGGVAFAGDRGISRVEVSTNGGATWATATLSPSKSGLTWVLWTFPWSPSAGGSYRIVARATDGSGAPQETSPSPPFPNGASGYDSITLLVA
jgi:DMSO/TMAO reductase YedYZ molybdopterin-dependent catalytic subunit